MGNRHFKTLNSWYDNGIFLSDISGEENILAIPTLIKEENKTSWKILYGNKSELSSLVTNGIYAKSINPLGSGIATGWSISNISLSFDDNNVRSISTPKESTLTGDGILDDLDRWRMLAIIQSLTQVAHNIEWLSDLKNIAITSNATSNLNLLNNWPSRLLDVGGLSFSDTVIMDIQKKVVNKNILFQTYFFDKIKNVGGINNQELIDEIKLHLKAYLDLAAGHVLAFIIESRQNGLKTYSNIESVIMNISNNLPIVRNIDPSILNDISSFGDLPFINTENIRKIINLDTHLILKNVTEILHISKNIFSENENVNHNEEIRPSYFKNITEFQQSFNEQYDIITERIENYTTNNFLSSSRLSSVTNRINDILNSLQVMVENQRRINIIFKTKINNPLSNIIRELGIN